MKLKSNKDSRLPSKQKSAKSLLLAKPDPISKILRCDQSARNKPPVTVHPRELNNATFLRRNSLALEEIPVLDLKPHPNNARKHSRQQIRYIQRSLEKFGQFRPIIANDSNWIISGHAVVEAAKALGLPHLLVLRLSHLTEDQVRQIVLSDNQLALKGHWDRKDLQREVQYFVSIGVDFESIGFDVTETEVILSEEFNVDPQGHEDLVPSPPDKSIASQPGDIWLLGDHVLMCGNALELTAYQALMGEAQAKMVFADPPYNVKIQGHVSGLGRTKHREFTMGLTLPRGLNPV